MNMCDKIYCFIIVYWKSYVGVTKESGLNRSSLRCPSSRTASQAWWNKAHLHTLFDTESTENTENTEDLKSRVYRLLEFIRCCYVLPAASWALALALALCIISRRSLCLCDTLARRQESNVILTGGDKAHLHTLNVPRMP